MIKPVPASVFSAAVTAAFVGFAGSIALILKAAESVNANALQTTSWITALCIGIAVTSFYLSFKLRMPVITAWSTPGAALIGTYTQALNIEQAVGAFILAAMLIVITMVIKPLSQLMKRIPPTVAAAMLAGILIKFSLDVIGAAHIAPAFVICLVLLFFIVQLYSAVLAGPVLLIAGTIISLFSGQISEQCCTLTISSLVIIKPTFDMPVMTGLGLPLFFVTMASQNLTGLAVLKSDNFTPSPTGTIMPTGIMSVAIAPFAAHGVCLAAITAAICSGPGCHTDAEQRWKAGPVYALIYILFAIFTQTLVEFLLAVPAVLITTFAGLALFGPLKGSLKTALGGDAVHTEAAVVTFIVTISGLTLFGIGSAMWGLLTGIIILGLNALKRTEV